MAVFEMGMNHQGEIRYLVHIAQPTVAVITNIGEAHIGNLGSRENIFKAKCEIFEGLSRGGLAVMNADDEYLPRLRQDADKQNQFHFLWVGESDSADFRAVNIDDTLQECVKFHALTPAGEFDVTVPALGRHMIYPALVSIAIGQHYGMSTGEILQGIRAYVPTAMRMETYHCPDNITIYNDTYNANPQSMKAGLTTLAHTKTKGARVAVLGDMLELGEMEERLHREIGAAVAALPVNTLITVGRRARWIADEARHKGMADVQSFDTAQQAQTALKPLLLPDTAIYFKASHLMALDQLATWCHAECDKR